MWEGLEASRIVENGSRMEFSFVSTSKKTSPKYSWVELFSISAVLHGFLVGVGAIIWVLFEGGRIETGEVGNKSGNSLVCFWDEPKGEGAHKDRLVAESSSKETADLVPFTIQMSAIGIAERFAPRAENPFSGSPGANIFGSTLGSTRTRGWFDSSQLPDQSAWLIDCSLSMGIHSQFEIAKSELLGALSETDPGTRVRVWGFAQQARELGATGGWSTWTPDRHKITQVELAQLSPVGSTDLAAALRAVFLTNPAVVQVLTDEDQLSHQELNGLLRLQGRMSKSMPRLRVVVLNQPKGETPLQQWCRQAGCSYKVVEARSVNRLTKSSQPLPRE